MNVFYKNKVVLITGSSMGIGKEMALQALIHGATVILTGRNLERLEKTQLEFLAFKEKVMIFQGNVTNENSNKILMKLIIEKYGRLDVLINNAGLSCYGEVDEMEIGSFKEIIDTNIYGSILPSKAALSELKKTQGNILFISSIAGFHGLPGYSAYSLSKMALKSFAQSLSVELKSSGVKVSIAFVGFTENEKDKKTLSPNGEWVEVPIRSSKMSVSRKTTASKLLSQVKSGQFKNTHSLLGKFTEQITRHLPLLTYYIFNKKYKRNLSAE